MILNARVPIGSDRAFLLDWPAILGCLISAFVPLWFLPQLIPGVSALRWMELQPGCPAWVMAQRCSTQPYMLSLLLMQCLEMLEACSLLTLLSFSFPHLLGGFRAPALTQTSSHPAPLFLFCLYHPVCLALVLCPWAWTGIAAASRTGCQLRSVPKCLCLLSSKIKNSLCSDLKICDHPSTSGFASSDPV